MSNFSTNLAQYRARFDALAPRERWLLSLGFAAIVIAVLFVGVWEPLLKNRAQNQQALLASRALSSKIENAAQMVQSSRPQQGMAVDRNTSLISAVDQTSKNGTLGKGPSRIQPQGDKEVRVWFEDVSFNALVSWAADLQKRYGVNIQTLDVEPKGNQGVVSVRLTLVRDS